MLLKCVLLGLGLVAGYRVCRAGLEVVGLGTCCCEMCLVGVGSCWVWGVHGDEVVGVSVTRV